MSIYIDNLAAEKLLKEVAHPVKLAFLTAAAAYTLQAVNTDMIFKVSGKIFNDPEALDEVVTAMDIQKKLGANVICVHGGGDQINIKLDKLGVEKQELGGRRLCDEITRDVSLEVLRENNLTLARRITEIDGELRKLPYFENSPEIFGQAEGGFNAGLIKAELLKKGYLTGINPVVKGKKFASFANEDVIPAIYTICNGPKNELVNVNADDVVDAIARALRALALANAMDGKIRKTIVFSISDLKGVLDENDEIIDSIFTDQVDFLLGNLPGQNKQAAVVTGGMVVKLESAIEMANAGIEVVILSPDAVIEELMTVGGQGTRIKRREQGETNKLDVKINQFKAAQAAALSPEGP